MAAGWFQRERGWLCHCLTILLEKLMSFAHVGMSGHRGRSTAMSVWGHMKTCMPTKSCKIDWKGGGDEGST